MKISRSDSSSLNAVITIDIERKDFEEKVSNVLTNYRKKQISQALERTRPYGDD